MKYEETADGEIEHAVEEFFQALDNIATKHDLTSEKWLGRLDGRGSDEAYEEWVQETWEFFETPEDEGASNV